MQTVRRSMPPRYEFRVGTRELAIFGGAFLVVWVLTFVFGTLVGRELARSNAARTPVAAGIASTSAADGSSPAERREPVPGKRAERGSSEERLTFYRTLTAPTLDLPPTEASPPKIEEHIVPHQAPAKPERRPPPAKKAARPETAALPSPSSPPPAAVEGKGTSATARGTAAGAVSRLLWTVQVSSFRSRTLAEELRGRLAAQGFDAYLVRVSTDEGRVWHRVRVGGYATRTEAERVAIELRAQRNLNPVVTSRTR